MGLAAALSVNAQEPLPPIQFNVPYVCANGLTYVIERCEVRGRAEVCFFHTEAKGQPPHENINVRSQLTGVLKTCPAAAAAKPASQAAVPLGIPTGRPTNPLHLREMPTVDRVLSEIQGSNPADTLARQLAVFGQLERAVEHLTGAHRYDKTPDELQVINTYMRAAYDLSQAFAKTHSAEEVKALNQLKDRYDMNGALDREAVAKLYSPALRAEFAKVDAAFEAKYRNRVEAGRRDAENMQKPEPANSPFVRNDPGTLAARRCVELGGSDLECIGKGFMTGLFGGEMSDLIAGKDQRHAGLTMTGAYHVQGSASLLFDTEAVISQGCGNLLPGSHAYTVAKNGNRFVITVQTEPKPLVLSLASDGRLTGPGLFDLKGKIISGYRDVWMQAYVNGAPAVGGYWAKDPIYADKIERCTIGSLAPAGPTGTVGTAISTAAGMAFGGAAEQAARDAQKDLPAPGVRVTGQYASQGGLALEFRPEGVILDCGEAHVVKKYTVENGASQVLVTVQNEAPFTLALQPNGALAGSGSVDVAGRVVTGSTPNGIGFGARNMRCSIGTLMPKSGAAAATNTAQSAAPTGGTAVLSLTSGLPAQPGRPNPIATVSMYLLKESFAGIATKNGIRSEPGKSAIEAWGAACDKQAPECSQVASALRPFIANRIKFDLDGRASFSAMPAGTYFLFGWISYEGRHLVWDLQVDLKDRAIGIVLDQRNAVSIK